MLKKIIELKLKQIGDRLKENYKATFTYSPAVVDTIAARCKEVDTGARNADHIITGSVLTEISTQVLGRIAEGHPVKSVDRRRGRQIADDLCGGVGGRSPSFPGSACERGDTTSSRAF